MMVVESAAAALAISAASAGRETANHGRNEYAIMRIARAVGVDRDTKPGMCSVSPHWLSQQPSAPRRTSAPAPPARREAWQPCGVGLACQDHGFGGVGAYPVGARIAFSVAAEWATVGPGSKTSRGGRASVGSHAGKRPHSRACRANIRSAAQGMGREAEVHRDVPDRPSRSAP
jgi:hypothetical protein